MITAKYYKFAIDYLEGCPVGTFHVVNQWRNMRFIFSQGKTEHTARKCNVQMNHILSRLSQMRCSRKITEIVHFI